MVRSARAGVLFSPHGTQKHALRTASPLQMPVEPWCTQSCRGEMEHCKEFVLSGCSAWFPWFFFEQALLIVSWEPASHGAEDTEKMRTLSPCPQGAPEVMGVTHSGGM